MNYKRVVQDIVDKRISTLCEMKQAEKKPELYNLYSKQDHIGIGSPDSGIGSPDSGISRGRCRGMRRFNALSGS